MESNQRPPATNLSVGARSQASLPTATTPHRFALRTTPFQQSGSPARGEGIEPSSPASKAGGLPLADPQECPARVELASPGWKPGTFAARPRARCRQRKERESNSQGREARPGSSGVPSPIGLPFRNQTAAEAGIEPATKRLTAALPYQHGTHRIKSVRMAGVEPAISCSPTNLRSVPDAECQAFPHPEIKSAQRESNPHIRHGKAVGSPLHHGRLLRFKLSKIIRAPGRTRIDVAALRVRSLRR